MRTCSKCLQPKPLTAFNKAAGYADGYQRQCKGCMAIAKKQWRARGGLKKEASTPAAIERQKRYRRNQDIEAPARVATRARAKAWRQKQLAEKPDEFREREKVWGKAYRERKAAAGPEPTDAQKAALFAEYAGTCAYCSTGKAECLEHVQPLTRGGSNAIENRVPSCLRCNNIKKDRPLHVFLAAKRTKRSPTIDWKTPGAGPHPERARRASDSPQFRVGAVLAGWSSW